MGGIVFLHTFSIQYWGQICEKHFIISIVLVLKTEIEVT